MTGRDPREEAQLWLTMWRDLGVTEVARPEKVSGPAKSAAAEPVDTGPRAPLPVADLLLGTRAADAGPIADVLAGADDPAAALARLQNEVLGDCTRCRLSEGRTKIVYGVGSPHARLMFVGEGPGADEDVRGEPFVGKAGQLLDRIIAAMGLARRDVYIANIVKCRPPENRAPLPDESAMCRPFLMGQIGIIRPAVIVALGKTAAVGLTGRDVGSITRERGRWLDLHGIPLMITFHPAYLLRNPSAKRPVWEDMQDVLARLGLPAPGRDAD